MNYDPRDPKNLGFYLTYIASEDRAPKLPRGNGAEDLNPWRH
jgi:hypothetical protein